MSMGDGGPAAELHAAVEPNIPVAELGAGGVHHVAFRIPDADYRAWPSGCRAMPSSGPVDRFYFRSLYFREPNGILFEIATDGPASSWTGRWRRSASGIGPSFALPRPLCQPRRLRHR
jgi:glyoxalase family protein